MTTSIEIQTLQTLSQIQKAIANQQLTCLGLVKYYLTNIQENNHKLNAFVEVFEQEALSQAIVIDQKIENKTAGKLAGLVLGIKDILCYQNHIATAGSKILSGFRSQITATAVQRLIDQDAIIIGRQNCDEFGMGSSSENSVYGAVCNAVDTSRVAGGSSGGSAVAVQANMCHASLGSDTGGSVRLPSSFCGVVGTKPSYGRISRWGLMAYASSFDCIGPITKSVADAALLVEIMAGPDSFDSTVSQRPVPKYSQNLSPKKSKIAYLSEGLHESIDPAVRQTYQAAIRHLQAQGHTVEPIEFSLINALLPIYYILTTAEVSSNLARLDGVRYGFRAKNFNNLESLYKQSRTQGFGAEARRRILLGTFVLSADYYDAYYTKAQKIRRLVQEETHRIFEEYDCILSPAAASTAFAIGQKSEDPIQMFLTDLFTVQANVVGCPAITVPFGTDQNNLPIGMQVMTPAFAEEQLFAIATALEKNC